MIGIRTNIYERSSTGIAHANRVLRWWDDPRDGMRHCVTDEPQEYRYVINNKGNPYDGQWEPVQRA